MYSGYSGATIARLGLWLKARIQVPTRPDWYFVKVYTHGANEANMPVLLGEPMVRFHHALAKRAAENPNFHYHYVTVREMYNLARAAEAGWEGSVAGARDFVLEWNGHPSETESTCITKSQLSNLADSMPRVDRRT